MVIVQFGEDNQNMIEKCMLFLKEKFPEVTSLQYIINQKKNETFSDQEVKLFHGKQFITEQFENYQYRIGPKSFFQTNSHQALRLYQKVREMASLCGTEIIYDLYCGTGTIGIFLSDNSKSVLAIDNIPEAIEDAKENALINKVNNIQFLAGDLKDFVSNDLIESYGVPDVVICDPPRAGMHQKVVENLIKLLPGKIIYVSCNPATQARDIALLTNHYEIISMQPVDMFPHTTHVENIALLQKKS
jgi:23S rRNA (uracil1939-C5)-methyltransferase